MIKTVKEIEIENKKVIIRCDFNVPIENKKIIDDTRIKESLETIRYCLNKNCKIILMSHLGRVKEEKDLKKNDLKIVAECLSKNDAELAKYWSNLGEIFINDAFATIHRTHASNVGIASHLPHGIGLLIKKELEHLDELKCPKKPFIVILGGKKVADKIGVIKNLAPKVDYLVIGGGMAFTFLKADGYNIGKSIIDEENISFCKEMLEKYEEKIVLPVDIKTNNEFKNEGTIKIKDITNIEENDYGLDIGPKSIENFKNIIKKSQTVFWNGPLGVYEFDNFKIATDTLLKYITKNKIKTILGGGDILAAAKKAGVEKNIYYTSTGGGATLEYLEGKNLPGLME